MNPVDSQPVVASPENWERELDSTVESINDRLIRFRRHLHSHPEPSGAEVKTSQAIFEELTEFGIQAHIGREGLGVVADLSVGQPAEESPRIGIRADIDALHVPDAKQTEYASQNPGLAHACGHDAHTTVVLGTALAIVQSAADWSTLPIPGLKLRFIFQPAEETSQGAHWMVEQDAMADVGYILGLHVDPERPFGRVAVRHGTLTANCDELEVQIEGRGGHAARPYHSKDPIAAAANLIQSAYAQLPRAIDVRNPAVMTFGQIHGGAAPNVIPQTVMIGGTLRTTDQLTRDKLKESFRQLCVSLEQAHGVKISARFVNPLHSVDNHPFVTRIMEEAALRVLDRDQVQILDLPSMGGEDFSVYLEHAPGAMLRVGCAPPGVETHMLHSPLFDIDERLLTLGPKILLRTAVMIAAEVSGCGTQS